MAGKSGRQLEESEMRKICFIDNPKKQQLIKTIPMEKNPTPPPIEDEYQYTDDFEDETVDIKPDLNYISTMLRNVLPSYSNEYIEQAYGSRGVLLNKPAHDSPRLKETTSTYGADLICSHLNPQSKEFVPASAITNSGDQIRLNPLTLEFKPHDTDQLIDKNADSLNPEQNSYNENSAKSVNDNPQATSLAKDQIRAKRNCILTNMFERFSKGLQNQPIDNIEFTTDYYLEQEGQKTSKRKSNSQFAKDSDPENRSQKICVFSDEQSDTPIGSFLTSSRLASDEINVLPDKSSDGCAKNITNGNADLRNVSPEQISLENIAQSHDEPVTSVSQKSNTDLNFHADSKTKVLSWLNADKKSDLVYQRIVGSSPKPIPSKESDDFFAFKVKSSNSLANTRSNNEGQADFTKKEVAPVPDRPSSRQSFLEIYNNLKAHREKASTNKTNNVKQTYPSDSFPGFGTTNTIWNKIEQEMHRKAAHSDKK